MRVGVGGHGGVQQIGQGLDCSVCSCVGCMPCTVPDATLSLVCLRHRIEPRSSHHHSCS